MAAVLATARSFGPVVTDISTGVAPVPSRRKLTCRWRIDPATGKLVCDWDDDPLPRQPVLHLRLVQA